MEENIANVSLAGKYLNEPAVDVAKSLQKYEWEDELWNKVTERFKKYGRGNKEKKGEFDITHTRTSVAWVKILGNLGEYSVGEIKIATAVMMLHDTGYDFSGSEGFVKHGNRSDVKQKDVHSEASTVLANRWRGEIKNLNDGFSDTEWSVVIELIRDHDDKKIFEQTTHHSDVDYHKLLPLIFAADTFGQIDIRSGVIPSFRGDDLRNYIDKQLQRRGDILQGDHAKEAFNVLKELIVEKYLNTQK